MLKSTPVLFSLVQSLYRRMHVGSTDSEVVTLRQDYVPISLSHAADLQEVNTCQVNKEWVAGSHSSDLVFS